MSQLTTDEMETVFLEVMLSNPPAIKTREAFILRKRLEADKLEADRDGVVLEMPFEW